jgi:hypothetical protein
MVSGNRGLGGTLPDAWNSMTTLMTVHLDDANFTGVPSAQQVPASHPLLLQAMSEKLLAAQHL